jgi:hypothetical protein
LPLCCQSYAAFWIQVNHLARQQQQQQQTLVLLLLPS